MRARKVKTARLGMVCCPEGNPDYAYVVVRINHEADRFQALMLWSNSARLCAGKMWEEPLKEFEANLRNGSVRRIA